MKNKIYTVPFLSALLATLLFITACTQEPIFYAIEEEVELKEAGVLGNVFSIVKLGANLYTANGKIYAKGLGSERGWLETSKPSGLRVVELASDANNLYARTAKQTDDNGENHSEEVWVLLKGTGAWTPVTGASSNSTVVIFDNAVVGDETTTIGRNAYVRVDEKVYLLKGATLDAEITTNGATKSTLAVAKLGTEDYFADTRAFCSYEQNLYRASEKNIQYANTFAGLTNSSVSVDESPLSFTIASGKLLVGTVDGLQEVTLDASGKPTGASNLDRNAEATIGESQIFSVVSFREIDNNAIYAGASKKQNSRYNALWGYYPSSRTEWNYE